MAHHFWLTLGLTFTALGCTSAGHQQVATQAEVSRSESPSVLSEQLPVSAYEGLPAGYTLSDTTDWGNAVEVGTRAILRREGTLIDTVDLAFGVAAVGRDSLVFLPVRTDTVTVLPDDPSSGFERFTTEFVLWTPISRKELREFLPYLDSYFSSLTKANASKVHYWGIAPLESAFRLYAMRYDFGTGRLDSLFVTEDEIATDYRYYLSTPRPDADGVRFGVFLIDSGTWRLIGRVPPSN